VSNLLGLTVAEHDNGVWCKAQQADVFALRVHGAGAAAAAAVAAVAAAACRCTSGCSCEARKDIDALHSLHQSTIYLVRLLVTQSEECEISVTLSDKTRSDGHKFKVCRVVDQQLPGMHTSPDQAIAQAYMHCICK
jgi:hypothetical protein